MATDEGVQWVDNLNRTIRSKSVDYVLSEVEAEYNQLSDVLSTEIASAEQGIEATRDVDSISVYALENPRAMHRHVKKANGITNLSTSEIVLGTIIQLVARQGKPPEAIMPHKVTRNVEVDEKILDAGITGFNLTNIGIASYRESTDSIQVYNFPEEIIPDNGIMSILNGRIPRDKFNSILQHEMTHAYVGGNLGKGLNSGAASAINEAAAWGINYLDDDPVNPEKYREVQDIPVNVFNIAQRIFFSRVENWQKNGLDRKRVISRLREQAVTGIRRLDDQSVDVVEALAPDKVESLKILQESIFHYERAETRAIDTLRWLGFAYQEDRREIQDEVDPEDEIDIFGMEVEDIFQEEIRRYNLGQKAKEYDSKIEDASMSVLDKPDFEPKSLFNQLAQARKRLNEINSKTREDSQSIETAIKEISEILRIYSEGVPAPDPDLFDVRDAKELIEKPSDYSSLTEYDEEFCAVLEEKLEVFLETLNRAEKQIQRIEKLEELLDQRIEYESYPDSERGDLKALQDLLEPIVGKTEKMRSMISSAEQSVHDSLTSIEKYQSRIG
jgi:hypothetical protein